MTAQFMPVQDLGQRRLFVTTIQTPLLDMYVDRIRTSTEAFEASSGGFSGGFPSANISGQTGLERLCRQLSGVSNVYEKLKQWSGELYYVEVDEDEDCFALQAEEYRLLKQRIENLIIDHIEREIVQDLRSYARM